MFEKAKWITAAPYLQWRCPDTPQELPASSYITKSFFAEDVPRRAVLNIVGYGQAAYFVNGKRIKDSILPTHPSNPQRAVIYNIYDITSLLLRGRNRIGAILGNNGANDMNVTRWRFEPKLAAQIDIEYKNGKKYTVLSDGTWTAKKSPVLFSMRRCGEIYDARLKTEGWCDSEFDDSSWEKVTVCRGPGGTFRTTSCPPVRIIRELEGREISRGLFDFGEMICGWVRIEVSAGEGSRIEINYSERLTEDGRHADRSGLVIGCGYMANKDMYISDGTDVQVWEQMFSYHGFRYAEITGDYRNVKATAVEAHTDIMKVSEFLTDNPVINAVHSACVKSVLANCHGALTDCPTREQNEWTGDGMLSAESVCIGFDAYAMFTEWMKKFKEDQFPDGALPCIIPSKNWLWESNFASGADWDSAIFHIPYYSFKYSGDRSIVDLMWENMNRSLRFLEASSETKLITSGVGDWCGLKPMCAVEITSTAYYRAALLMMAEMAEATGRESGVYLEEARVVRESFRKKYVKDGKVAVNDETAIAAALWSRMLDEKEAGACADELARIIIANGNCFSGGVHELRMIFDVLSERGYSQLLFDAVVNEKKYGYGYCIKKGLDTLPERFDFEKKEAGTESLNHHFRSSVNSWFYKWLAGIRLCGFGYGDVWIAPEFVNGVERLSASMHGIQVSYDSVLFEVSSPYSFNLVSDSGIVKYAPGKYAFPKEKLIKKINPVPRVF